MAVLAVAAVLLAGTALYSDVFLLRSRLCLLFNLCGEAAPPLSASSAKASCREGGAHVVFGAAVKPCIRHSGKHLEIYTEVVSVTPDDPTEVTVWFWLVTADNVKTDLKSCTFTLSEGARHCGPEIVVPTTPGHYSAAADVTLHNEPSPKWMDNSASGMITKPIYWSGR
ncbi:hypothetical protein [Sinosporangium siamense]|uniref:Uncharacterized protein n=1 Tax=Sinosporangium siamense TaxID=1367973 RepID=A0A919RJK3_9ACTN|nr:hypothetical protein [Sinosporangium siamense]GII95017.1 hypothetical protein Ssi02_52480 [Sinosporangium siamense]